MCLLLYTVCPAMVGKPKRERELLTLIDAKFLEEELLKKHVRYDETHSEFILNRVNEKI